jgi:hypothetical protein
MDLKKALFWTLSIFLTISAHAASPPPPPKNPTKIERKSHKLKLRLYHLQTDWDNRTSKDADGNTYYSDETNNKYLPQVIDVTHQILRLDGVVYTEDPKGVFNISHEEKNRFESLLNKFAYSIYHDMNSTTIAYDPLDLYKNNYGGGFDLDTNRISLSNGVMCLDGDLNGLLSSNEVHESVHAEVAKLQKEKILWHPLWGELGSLPSTTGFLPPYTHSIYFDELAAYHKQLLFLLDAKTTAAMSKKERFRQINRYFSVYKNLTHSIFETLPRFQHEIENNYEVIVDRTQVDPNSSHFQIFYMTDLIGSHLILHKDGYHLDLILPYYKGLATDLEKITAVEDQINKVSQLITQLITQLEAGFATFEGATISLANEDALQESLLKLLPLIDF